MGATDKVVGHPIILFDGVCNLCNGAVNTTIKYDTKSVFKFAALQSDFAQKQLQLVGLSTAKFDSIVLLKHGKVFYKSNAALEIAKDLSGLWRALIIFKIVPRSIRDALYDFIARNRYSFFGKKEQCMIPTPALKARFIA